MLSRTTPSRRGYPVAGLPVGIVVLDTSHELLPGNVQHAASFARPVLYEVVSGVSIPDLLAGDLAAEPSVVAAVLALERKGVSVVVGACGSFANYQQAARAAARIPVCLSILCVVPFLLATLGPQQKLGIVMGAKRALSPRVLRECLIDGLERLVVVEAVSSAEFQMLLSPGSAVDHQKVARDLAELGAETQAREPEIGAWLFQCSDLPPYAQHFQQAVRRPVHDMTTLIEFFSAASERRPFPGRWSPADRQD